jgi:hypothetical protein
LAAGVAWLTFPASAREKAPGPDASVTVTVERSVPGVGVEQEALVLSQSAGSRWVRSSNFLEAPSATTVLGARTARLGDRGLAELSLARNAASRAARRRALARMEARSFLAQGSPHEPLYRADGSPLAAGSPERDDLRRMLGAAAELGDWKDENAARVSWEKDNGLVIRTAKGSRKLNAKEACVSLGRTAAGPERWRCSIQGFGVAYLTPPSLE